MDEPTLPALGAVVETDRGSLPFALVHGESLVGCASWALGEAGITAVDLGTEWAGVQEAGEPFVLHDPLCPMTPAWFLAGCVEQAVDRDAVVVGVRPVTDTVKTTDGGFVGDTVDRSGLVVVASPIVLPAPVVAAVDGLPTTDFAALVDWLRERFAVELVEAPADARRVSSQEELAVLEALTGRDD
jgi:2-C-methyl-D-erythritol 4-phosphate cytidylyltransferase